MTAHAPMNPDGPRVVGPRRPEDDARAEKQREGRRLVRTQLGLVVGSIALCLMVGIAGVPGVEEPEAGDGSAALRRGWAQEWAKQAEAEPVPAALETDRAGLDLDRVKR